MNNHKPLLEYLFLLVIILLAVTTFFYLKDQEITLCQKALSGLVNGADAAQRYIDWRKLYAMEINVGASFGKLRNEKERTNYKKEFIKNFSFVFKKVGGEIGAFTNWRIHERRSNVVVVAADYALYNKTLLFSVSKSFKRKLVGLQWK